MDSLTHVVLGAAIGEALAGKKLGKKAMLLGAAAQSLPDIDFVAFLWTTPAEDLLEHRGFTHSFLFLALATGAFALLARQYWANKEIGLREWLILFGVEIATHDFIDAFNAYGTGWFEPFAHTRVSFNTLFVADPFFTLGPMVAAVALLLLPPNHPRRLNWAYAGIVGAVIYLGYAVSSKISATEDIEVSLTQKGIAHDRFFTTPTPLNTWLWYAVAQDKHGFHVGFRSIFDRTAAMNWHYFPQNDSLLNPVHDHEELQHLKRFSQGYYTAEMRGDSLVFNDLRFGQNGWSNPEAKFVFNFYLSHQVDNRIVIQRGRFSHWNKDTLLSFLQRIKGN